MPLGALAALGGAYPASTLPILGAAAMAFLVSGARVGGRETRLLDIALLGVVAAAVVQLLPLPAGVAAALSPHGDGLRAALFLDPGSRTHTLSVDPALTRAGLASLVSALLIFWAARDLFSRGGLRITARAIAWGGFVLTLVAFIQRATAPNLLLWTWTLDEPGSQPFGPFVNRNHLATWLLMGAALTAGYLMSHSRSHSSFAPSLRLRIRDWLEDGNGLLLAGALVTMLLGIAGTLSRAGILGATAALATGGSLSRLTDRRRRVRIAVAVIAVLLAFGVWSNRDGLASKFESNASASRVTIWRETIPVVQDFWLTGTGIGTYGPTMLQYQHVMPEVHFNQAHSEYLQIASEGGLIVLVPLVIAIAAGLRTAARRLREDTRALAWLRVGAAAGLVGVAVQGLFETGLRIPANGLLAALLAAIVLHTPAMGLTDRAASAERR